MALAVLHGLDGRPVTAGRGQQLLGQLAVGELGAAADVVDLPRPAALGDELDAAAVIGDVQPVAHVEAVTVERHLPAVDQIGDEERNHLFGELVRPVVVRTPRDAHGQSVRAVEGAREQIRGSLGSRVRRVRFEDVLLRPRAALDGAVDLIGGDVHEPADARVQGALQQRLRAQDVGQHEVGRALDGPVDVRLGGEVDDHVDAAHLLGHDLRVADVAAHELELARDRCEVGLAARVGELVQHHHFGTREGRVRAAHQLPHIVRADEPGPTCHQYAHAQFLPWCCAARSMSRA